MHSRVYGPACPTDRPHTHRWARRVFLNGKSDDAREGMSTYACPCVHISARQASAHASCTDEFLRSRCAGDAPLVDAAATAVIAGAVAAVPAAAAPPPVAAPVPPRRVLAVASMRAIAAPAATPSGGFARVSGFLSLCAAVGNRGVRGDRPEALRCALVPVCGVLGARTGPRTPRLALKPSNGPVYSSRLKPCRFLHRIPHNDHGRTLASHYIKDW